MIVMKFGGTSVQNTEMIDSAISIAENQLERSPLLVSSAMGKTTDKLVAIADAAVAGDSELAFSIYEDIKASHFLAINGFLSGENLQFATERAELLFEELASLVKGLSLLRECSPRSTDAILSFGELLSTTIISARARERGIETILLDSRKLVKTDDNFNAAVPIMDKTGELIRGAVNPMPNRLYVAQGFISTNMDGATTTLGRGGSDYTATIYGSSLDAEEVQIWTDVNGIMTSDPRIIPEAKTIANISYDEAAELAFFGAKVVHPSTIVPAVDRKIPVLVKSTKDPDGLYTTISPASGNTGLKAISTKKNITLIEIKTGRMVNAYGFLAKIFSIFEKHETSVDIVTTSEVSVSMTIENRSNIEAIIDDLNLFGQVSVEEDKNIICLVGQDLWQDSSVTSKLFQTLEGMPIRMISLGASRINLTLVVPETSCNDALKRIHAEFF
ncbi:MAG: lysine-sensitive aspartokinase 3 [Spirochaetales bacterium]|uniref:Aspartokinase n=1 Tax=Candidatus Thalassospirochaeta sargassi TaxID=3119039 RepID=A0AAJ1MNR4_9SPIO|nr:lysine-sensitive aspartokinase 3 [Spirochaetales bacterium]